MRPALLAELHEDKKALAARIRGPTSSATSIATWRRRADRGLDRRSGAAQHGLADTSRDQVNADLLAFCKA